ncbi:MAG: hypothetical protein QOD56_2980 [Gammaproteobacteria bacterium]|nr:hypothetical protein [Gammaproteobacteria bacterium]
MFRELASQPIAPVDYLLGAAQGIAGWLALSRAQNAGLNSSIAEIFGKALVIGSIAGIASLFLFGAIYSRLGSRTGSPSARTKVIHVLAYGGVPMVASLVVWVLTALLTGEATFEQTPRPDVEGFVAFLLHAQFFAYLLLQIWSVVIQVMGLSEIQGLATRKALGLWMLGQLIGFLALLFLVIVLATLFPNAVTG